MNVVNVSRPFSGRAPLLAAAVSLVVLGGCRDNASKGEDVALAQGRWTTKMSLSHADLAGSKGQMIQQLLERLESESRTFCRTAQSPDRPSTAFFGGVDDDLCRYDEYRVEGDTLSLAMTCRLQFGIEMTLKAEGKMSPKRFSIPATTTLSGGPITRPLSLTGQISGEHTGSCKAAN